MSAFCIRQNRLTGRSSASVALRNPANWNRAVPLSYEQFRCSFANEVGVDEAKGPYLGYIVPGAGDPLFQSASAQMSRQCVTKSLSVLS